MNVHVRLRFILSQYPTYDPARAALQEPQNFDQIDENSQNLGRNRLNHGRPRPIDVSFGTHRGKQTNITTN